MNTVVDEEFAERCARAWQALPVARDAHRAEVSPAYDEVFHETVRRVEEAGSIGKTDIAALVVWKRVTAQTPWAGALMSMPDAEVRARTAGAVAAVRDPALPRAEAACRGRAELTALPGFRSGDALASALLTAAAPTRMAVFDEHVHRALEHLGFPLAPAPLRYARYMQLLDDLLARGGGTAAGWTARDVDTALSWMGRTLP